MPEERRFVRTRKGRLVAGVCSGLGAQLGVDPLLLRIAFVGLAFLGGAGFWLYVAIFLLTPEEGATRAPIRLRRSAWPRVAGVLAVVVAIGIALSSVHWLTNATPGLIAAFVLLAFIAVVARYARRRLRAAARQSESRSADLRLAGNVAAVAAVAADIGLFALAGAWLAGQGAVPIFNLMEDAATAEISRSQVWQWIRSPKGKLDDERKVTKEMVAAMIPEELMKIREYLGPAYGEGRYEEASKIFADLVNNDAFVEFLTLPAYERID